MGENKIPRWDGFRPLFLKFIPKLVGVLVALAICGLLLLGLGADPIIAYRGIFYGALGNVNSLTETLVKATPILLISFGLLVVFKCGFFNIGAEGQFWMGIIFATGLGIALNLPSVLFIPLLMIAGSLGGALWGAIPALMKGKAGINEIISTLMMNYVAILIGSYLYEGPWRNPTILGNPETALISSSAWLPRLIPGMRLHAGFIVALLSLPLVYVIVQKTIFGYEIKAVGANPKAAAAKGISLTKTYVLAMLISGGLAGLAGMVEISGLQHRMTSGISPGYGFSAIYVSWLGGLNPIGVLLASLFVSVLFVGGDTLQFSVRIPVDFVYVLQGVVVISTVVVGFLIERLIGAGPKPSKGKTKWRIF